MSRPRRRYRSSEEIQQLVSSYYRSGLTPQAFSSCNDVPLSSLHRYLRQYRETEPSSPQLIPVNVAGPGALEPTTDVPPFELHLTDDRRITIPHGFDAVDLARLLEVLGC
jgi:hypothetical protein